jgi:hypothetical protein
MPMQRIPFITISKILLEGFKMKKVRLSIILALVLSVALVSVAAWAATVPKALVSKNLINDPSFVTLTALPYSSSDNNARVKLQITSNKGIPVEVSYLVLNPAGTPVAPVNGTVSKYFDAAFPKSADGTWQTIGDAGKNTFYHTEVGGWGQPWFKNPTQQFVLPHYRTCILMLARYDKIYTVILRENDNQITYKVLKGAAFKGMKIKGLANVTRVGDNFQISSDGSPVEVGLWDKGVYTHDEVNGWAQPGYTAKVKNYPIPKYGMFMLNIARYGKMGLIIGNMNDGKLGTVVLTGSKEMKTITMPGFVNLKYLGMSTGLNRLPQVEVKATGKMPVEVSSFGYDNSAWQWEVNGWGIPQFKPNPQTFKLKHYTPGFMMYSRYGKGGFLFYNENDGKMAVLTGGSFSTANMAVIGPPIIVTATPTPTPTSTPTVTPTPTSTPTPTPTPTNSPPPITTNQNLTVAGFKVINFQGIINPNGSFTGSGQLVIPLLGNVNATFAVNAQGQVTSGSWNGNITILSKPYNVANGTIDSTGLKANVNISIAGLPKQFSIAINPTGVITGSFAGSLGFSGYNITNVTLTLNSSGITGTGKIVIGNIPVIFNLNVNNQGQLTGSFNGTLNVSGYSIAFATLNLGNNSITGTGKINVAGIQTVFNLTLNSNGSVNAKYAGNLTYAGIGISGLSLDITSAGMKGTGTITIAGASKTFSLSLNPLGALTGTYSGSLTIGNTTLASVTLNLSSSGITGTGTATVLGQSVTLTLSVDNTGKITGTGQTTLTYTIPGTTKTVSLKNATLTLTNTGTISGSGTIAAGNISIAGATFTVSPTGGISGTGSVSIGGVAVSSSFSLGSGGFAVSGSTSVTKTITVGVWPLQTSVTFSASVSLSVKNTNEIAATASGTVKKGSLQASVSGSVDLASGKVTVSAFGLSLTFDLF